MSLDLFANFERSSNSSVFYRLTSENSSTFAFKLSDMELPNVVLRTMYQAEYSLNGAAYEPFNVDSEGFFILSENFDTQVPCVCSITVSVSTVYGDFFNTFSLSGVFVESFPTADFIAYPKLIFSLNEPEPTELNGTNYTLSPGVSCFGEGHTETIYLSSNADLGYYSNWYVGNDTTNIQNRTSVLPVTSDAYNTAYAEVSSTLSDTRTYPISLWLTNSAITTSGPFITYEDETGIINYYPFFTSTTSVGGIKINEKLKGEIKVFEYPNLFPITIQSPFEFNHITLPLTYEPEQYTASILFSDIATFLTENFTGTKWELSASSHIGNWSIPTTFLSAVTGYRFELEYDETSSEVALPIFTASPLLPTNIVLSVSAFKNITINFPPYDWLPKTVCDVSVSNVTVDAFPTPKLYIPNFYNLKDQDVEIIFVGNTTLSSSDVTQIKISSPQSQEVLTLSGNPITIGNSGTLKFDKYGLVDLYIVTTLTNKYNTQTVEYSAVLQNQLEIVTKLDQEPNEDFFQSSLTPLKLTYGYKPQITPNEWAIADNVNSIIEKIYTTIDDLDDYTKLYEKKSVFYGWLGHFPPQSALLYGNETIHNQTSLNQSILDSSSLYVWQDLECYDLTTSLMLTWVDLEGSECTTNKTWEYQTCKSGSTSQQQNVVASSSCLQKYCVDWKWSYRKSGYTNINITWKDSRSNGAFAKKWKFEKCELLPDVTNDCEKDSWKIATIDPFWFPIPYKNISRCKISDVKTHSNLSNMVIAYPTRIELVTKGYFPTIVDSKNFAEELFPFQNIVGIAVNSNNKVVVLDSLIPRITVFNIIDNKFSLFVTWGDNGTAEDPRGFSSPTDIHIDDKNCVWISDAGNYCVKKLTIIGNYLLTLQHEKFNNNPPISVCVDSVSRVHCLTQNGVIVFDEYGNYNFEYTFPSDVTNVKKINVSYNKEMIYITYESGVLKYFRTGLICNYVIQDVMRYDQSIITGYNSATQDEYRNVYVSVEDKIFKIADLQQLVESKASIPADLYWSLDELKIHKEEYVQPWVYLKSFHRLWDNIELLRTSLFYDLSGCKSYVAPTYTKEDLVIGQNEIVTNSVINRITDQLWTNLQSLINYFDPTCEK